MAQTDKQFMIMQSLGLMKNIKYNKREAGDVGMGDDITGVKQQVSKLTSKTAEKLLRPWLGGLRVVGGVNMELYDYPVMLTAEEYTNATGIELVARCGNDAANVKRLLNRAHSHIYDFLIYSTGCSDIKDRIINAYRDRLEKPIKRALIMQVGYLLENGAIGDWNGLIATAESGADLKSTQELVQKILSPEIINLLGSTQPNILYAGG